MSDAPYVHDASGTVRFWVETDSGNAVSASIGKATRSPAICSCG